MVLESKLKKTTHAARLLRSSTIQQRNKVLTTAADFLISEQPKILKANQNDLKALPPNTAPAFRDRLTLNPERIQHMAHSLRLVAKLPDPLSNVDSEKRIEDKTNPNFESRTKQLKNGLILKKIRSPLGVIFMIFESRPNVAVEAFSMGFKSGNVMILRGGKESQKTVQVLYSILKKSILLSNLPAESLWGITDSNRQIVSDLLKQNQFIDVVVPRGGEKLIDFVVKNSHIPIIKNDRGLCHVYVHSDADLDMATKIILNAKTQRPAVCNSIETILVHSAIARTLLPKLFEALNTFHVEWYTDAKSFSLLKRSSFVKRATTKSWQTEYLDQKINCKIVSSIDEALEHIETYGSRHSECIVTASEKLAKKFQHEIDAAVVYWNASTRFTDGYEFGLGGELGISTQKLHVRGPVGLMALTSERWIVDGTGQTR